MTRNGGAILMLYHEMVVLYSCSKRSAWTHVTLATGRSIIADTQQVHRVSQKMQKLCSSFLHS